MRNRPAASLFERLEDRSMFAVSIAVPIVDQNLTAFQPVSIDLSNRYTSTDGVSSVVRLTTTSGVISLALSDNAGLTTTVNNFLAYVNGDRYNNTIFHRTWRDETVGEGISILQGGGFTFPTLNLDHVFTNADSNARRPAQVSPFAAIPLQSNVMNNTAYTIAMARTDTPDSATSQFFFNLIDNPELNFQNVNNRGYAAFGTVFPGASRTNLDALYATPDFDMTGTYRVGGADPIGGALQNLPLRNRNGAVASPASPITPANFIGVTDATAAPGVTTELTVTSSHPQFLTATIEGNQLVLTPQAGWIPGQAINISVQAKGLDGTSVVDTFVVNAPATEPFASAIQSSTSVVAGNTLTMRALGVRDFDSALVRVEFFHDDGDGLFDDTVDTLAATVNASNGQIPAGGWTARIDTTGYVPGNNRFFVRIVSTGNGNPGNTEESVLPRNVNVIAAPAAVAVTPESANIAAGQTTAINVTGVTHAGTEAPRAQVFMDTSADNTLDPFADRAIGFATFNAQTNSFSFTPNPSLFATGANRFFIRITDSFGNVSSILTTTVTQA